MGARLSELRRDAGLSQEALAHAAGLDRSFYVDFENGHHSITVDRLFDVADALNVSVSRLFDGL